MIPNPKEVAVEVLNGLDVEDKTMSVIRFFDVTDPPEGPVWRFVLSDRLNSVPIAMSLSARALSRWALDRGAKAVRFDFDLRFEC